MKTVNELKKITNSLVSMMLMNKENAEIKAGNFLTQYFYTDRRSVKIVKVKNGSFITADGLEVFVKNGQLMQFSSKIEFIKGLVKNDFSNLKEVQQNYINAGGQFNPFLLTVIPGMTRQINRRLKMNDCKITENDQTYFDPSF